MNRSASTEVMKLEEGPWDKTNGYEWYKENMCSFFVSDLLCLGCSSFDDSLDLGHNGLVRSVRLVVVGPPLEVDTSMTYASTLQQVTN